MIEDAKNLGADAVICVRFQTSVMMAGDNDPKEFYLGILLDRTNGKNVIMASTRYSCR